LLTPVTSCDDEVVDTGIDHRVLDEINHGAAKHLNHWFWTSERQRSQAGTLSSCHDDAVQKTSLSGVE
jgi:hypothetical protein